MDTRPTPTRGQALRGYDSAGMGGDLTKGVGAYVIEGAGAGMTEGAGACMRKEADAVVTKIEGAIGPSQMLSDTVFSATLEMNTVDHCLEMVRYGFLTHNRRRILISNRSEDSLR